MVVLDNDLRIFLKTSCWFFFRLLNTVYPSLNHFICIFVFLLLGEASRLPQLFILFFHNYNKVPIILQLVFTFIANYTFNKYHKNNIFNQVLRTGLNWTKTFHILLINLHSTGWLLISICAVLETLFFNITICHILITKNELIKDLTTLLFWEHT